MACNAASAKFHCRLCKCKTCGFCRGRTTAAAKPVAATSGQQQCEQAARPRPVRPGGVLGVGVARGAVREA